MWSKIRIVLGIAIFVAVAGFMQAARAEYYMDFPEPPIVQVVEYRSPHHYHHYHHKKKHHRYYSVAPKRYSHYEMTITYFVPVCPSCACGGCYRNYQTDEQLNRRAYNNDVVTYQYVPESNYETYDMRTEDDDVMNDPDMNNQYINDY